VELELEANLVLRLALAPKLEMEFTAGIGFLACVAVTPDGLVDNTFRATTVDYKELQALHGESSPLVLKHMRGADMGGCTGYEGAEDEFVSEFEAVCVCACCCY
jgi:hypothetical protein